MLFAGSIFAGGGNRNGTAGATELLIPVGARGIAMGGATLTNSYGIEALYWNPANIARTSYGVDVMATHMNYIADITLAYAAAAVKVGDLGTLAISLKSLSFGDIAKTTVQYPDGTGTTFSPEYSVIGFAYSKLLSDRVSVGITANFINETIDFVSASGVSFDIGITYTDLGGIEGFNMSVLMRNLGPRMKFDGSGLYVKATPEQFRRTGSVFYKIESQDFELPTSYEIGLGYNYSIDEYNKLEFAGLFRNNNFYEDEYKIGVEYGYNNLIFLRAGYEIAPELKTDDTKAVYGMAAGLGINYKMGNVALKIDYAYRAVEYFDANHIITVGLGL